MRRWKEYGNISDGVLIGVKKQWLSRNAHFMINNKKVEDDIFKIFSDDNSALDYIKKGQHDFNTNPFYIYEFAFYKMIYDDNLRKNIGGMGLLKLPGGTVVGRTITSQAAGIIKSTQGLSVREGKESYIKNWSSEKEIRLKVGIKQFDNQKNGHAIHDNKIYDNFIFPKIAVPIKDDAFDVIKIRFSPEFIDRDKFIDKIKEIRPNSEIEILE